MAEIEFLLLDQTAGRMTSGKIGRFGSTAKLVAQQEEMWHGFSLRLHRMNAVWTQFPRRICDYVEKQKENGRQLWTDRMLDPFLHENVQPLPSPQLASFFLKSQPFRQIMLFHRGKVAWEWERFWQEKFLESCYQDLNGLYLLGETDTDPVFLDQIYEDSGLLAVVGKQIPEVDGRKCVFVELDTAARMDCHQIPQGCVYLDLTSDQEKQRCLKLKRTDISYVSARNFLDTALKARYNAI